MRFWILAARLRTLPLAFSSILIGTTLATSLHPIKWSITILTFLTAFLLQILSNWANDLGDAISGVDSKDREGPKRTVQSGAISSKGMKRAIVFLSILIFIVGIFTITLAFDGMGGNVWWYVFFVLGLFSIGAALAYTLGKRPYGYIGFGDLFVMFFFGYVAVGGSFFLQTTFLSELIIYPATAMGFLATAVLNVNNIRDIDSDKSAGKQSIPVRVGRKKALGYHTLLIVGGMIFFYLSIPYEMSIMWKIFFLIPAILFLHHLYAVIRLKSLDKQLKVLALNILLVAILFSVAYLVHL